MEGEVEIQSPKHRGSRHNHGGLVASILQELREVPPMRGPGREAIVPGGVFPVGLQKNGAQVHGGVKNEDKLKLMYQKESLSILERLPVCMVCHNN